jgi:hypothetical protein
MSRTSLSMVLSFAVLMPAVGRAEQRHIADRNALDRMVAEQVSQQEADRQVIRGVLKRDEVRDVARKAGLDIVRAEAAVATLSGTELQDAARRARVVNERLAGGGNITISTTTIIIALLVIILIIVAVD